MMMAYVVVEYGYCMSNVYGPFNSCRAARTAADRLASKETDNRLTFLVRRLYKRAGVSGAFGVFRGRVR